MMNNIMVVHSHAVYPIGKTYKASILDVDENYKTVATRVLRQVTKEEYLNFVASQGAEFKHEKGLGTYFYEIEILPD